jgi:Na+/glutamate symporter
MKRFIVSLTSGAMLSLLIVHALEDIILLSIGRFAPLPTYIMYSVGMVVSWLVFGVVLTRLIPHKH